MSKSYSSTHPDIRKSETLDSNFYFDDEIWQRSKENIFASCWNYVGHKKELFGGNVNMVPIDLLDQHLNEPLLLIKDENEGISCYPNICTHRAFKLVAHPTSKSKITCAYHGRRFDLQGKFEFMPEFAEALDFPRPCDHLANVPLKNWRDHLFVSLNEKMDFDKAFKEIDKRLYFMPFKDMRHAREYDETYTVSAHWALYCENYLEGFHIPFVHQSLGSYLDYGTYETLVEDHVVLQIGHADSGSPVFDLPEGHPDYGSNITGYYFWLYPNFMLNCYPWGIQYNIVKPITPELCKVQFVYYVYDQAVFDHMEASKLANKTEREDEFVVEAVQKGLKSRYYKSGRFSPKREKGVHQFQRLQEQYLQLS